MGRFREVVGREDVDSDICSTFKQGVPTFERGRRGIAVFACRFSRRDGELSRLAWMITTRRFPSMGLTR